MPVMFMYYVHYRRGGVQPLIYQTMMGLYGLYKNPLFKIYVLGEKGVKRPFAAAQGAMPPGMAEALGGGGGAGEEEVVEVVEEDEEEGEEEGTDDEEEDEEEEESSTNTVDDEEGDEAASTGEDDDDDDSEEDGD